MHPIICITFRFIQPFPLFHGSGDGGVPEWPPSPMRAFQAIVNAASLRYRGQSLPAEVESALTQLESIRPTILAPNATPAQVGHRAYVPHNQADLVSAAWHRGNIDASIANHRMEKDIRPMRIEQSSEDLPELHYLFPVNLSIEDSQSLLDVIRPCARAVSALGWGIDLVAADATIIAESTLADTQARRWQPVNQARNRLRVQRAGSFIALRKRHERFLNRLIDGKFDPVPPITTLDVVPYASDAEPTPRPHAVFKLLDPNEDPARYPHAKLMHIAAMVRHVAIEVMRNAPPPWLAADGREDFVSRIIRGKRDEAATGPHQQIAYVPLPSIGHEHADGIIRNVMIVAPVGLDRELEYLAERLDGQMLQPETQGKEQESYSTPASTYSAELRRFEPPPRKFIAERYLGVSRVWRSVTPVILDGHNKKSKSDKLEAIQRETQKLITKALIRAGIETRCEFAWQSTPYLKNCLSAHKYDREGRYTGYHRPQHLKDLTAVHMELNFANPVPGPITLGAGRYCGFGLFSTFQDSL